MPGNLGSSPPLLTAQFTTPGSSLIRGLAGLIAPPVPATGTVMSARWRRKFRRYVHWLERQATNFSNSVGVFTPPGISPVLSTAEITVLNGIKTFLSGLGYVVGTPAGAQPITPP